MQGFDKEWQAWLATDNRYAIEDKPIIKADI